MKFPNQVMALRLQRDRTRDDLAQAAGVTRQTIGLIETGKVCPSTIVAMRISKYLGYTVEELFSDPATGTSDIHLVDERLEAAEESIRVWVTDMAGNRIARRADGPVSGGVVRGSHAIYHPFAPPAQRVNWLSDSEGWGRTLFVSGCDSGLGVLADTLGRTSRRLDAVWFGVPNQRAIEELEQRWTHVAAVHHVGRLDWSDTRFSGLPRGNYTLVQFARAEMGWIVPRGNPERFRGADDFGGGRLRLVNRQRGSGARQQMDTLLNQAGVPSARVSGYQLEVGGHLAVAEAIRNGFADVGFGHSLAAANSGLSFIPVQEEVCTLIIANAYLTTPAVRGLLGTLNSDRFRHELATLGPYDVGAMGQVMN